MAAGKGARSQREARAGRLAQLRKEQAARERRHKVLIWGSVGVTLLVLTSLTGFDLVRRNANRPDLSGVQSFQVSPAHVTTKVNYPQTPPAGGEHAPIWLNCATYQQPVPNENAVHSLEHGAVWVTYQPDLPKDQVATLQKMMGNTYEILSPYPGLPAPVVASAWGKQLQLTGADDKRLGEFIRTYRQGPQAPESGAACTGGTDGTTMPTAPTGP